MATKLLPSYEKGTVLRLANQTEAAEAVFTLLIPGGTAVTAGGEVYKVARMGDLHTVRSVSLEVSGSLAASGLTFDAGTDLVGDCFIDGADLGNGAGGSVTKVAGLEAADTFADGYVGPSTAIRDLTFTIIGTATTPVTAGDRYITYRVTYSRNMPEALVTGVSNPLYPLAGALVTAPASEFDYNGNATSS